MDKLLQNPLIKKIINIPILWDIAQNILGENQWKRVMYSAVFEKRGGALMDFGCSIGNETEAFLDFDYYGVDIDAHAIEAAKKRFEGYPQVKFFCLDITKESFKKNFFDHILFAATGHHLSDEELPGVIEALMGQLKDGGQLHFLDHIRRPWKDGWVARGIVRIDQGRFVRTEEQYKKYFDPQKLNITHWEIKPSPDKLIKLPDFLYIRIVKAASKVMR